MQTLFDVLLPRRTEMARPRPRSLALTLDHLGFDRVQHEQIRTDLRNGRIGLAQNRLPASTDIRGCRSKRRLARRPTRYWSLGQRGVARGTRSGGLVSGRRRQPWTRGAGVVKALNPLPNSPARTATLSKCISPRAAVRCHLRNAAAARDHHQLPDPRRHCRILACARTITDTRSLVLIRGPLGRTAPDSHGARSQFAWEETPQQLLDEQKQKVRESLHAALIGWARHAGEGADYTANLPLQCLHPTGHWYEVPNMLRNGVLARLLECGRSCNT